MVRGRLVFISGGVRSGKTAFAENWLVTHASGRLVYVATGRPVDGEMRDRIRHHRRDRSARPESWETFERPADFPGILPMIREGDGVLIDCITTWLANEMYEGIESGLPCHRRQGCLETKVGALLAALSEMTEKASAIVVVSNEVLEEPLPAAADIGAYSEMLGYIHQQLVSMADIAYEMDAGIPLWWKPENGKRGMV
ncbi:adenosylcobinamide kinase /adenosylcobinamide-phosphate guanylyltransferase [Bhargavaea ginsengi]|uniref:Adenosylcobinamide kinase n=1 Tax=Bhargavaea ginsengi TaxID=426757 RepID=A0A1H7AW51_9BACL|nr:bifunctional adenosylcobinamide kinase/adenosylcobinamide-phosphate guanylyltransferase [Bhargavaea ginsengi]SEJ65285.1 adenosylcobinamide kinase /adenosylcobinamide-phosphate guanylyltransferase [Bhargavaea ginsengi]